MCTPQKLKDFGIFIPISYNFVNTFRQMFIFLFKQCLFPSFLFLLSFPSIMYHLLNDTWYRTPSGSIFCCLETTYAYNAVRLSSTIWRQHCYRRRRFPFLFSPFSFLFFPFFLPFPFSLLPFFSSFSFFPFLSPFLHFPTFFSMSRFFSIGGSLSPCLPHWLRPWAYSLKVSPFKLYKFTQV